MDSRPILLLCCNYRLPELTAGFLRHLDALSAPVEVAVSDNDGSLTTAHTAFPFVHVYSHPDNPGYFGGCARALDAWRREHDALPRWVGVVNTDLEFAADFFPRLLAMTVPDDVAAVAPHVCLPDGWPQNPFLRERPTPAKIQSYSRIFSHDAVFLLWDLLYHLKRNLRRALRPRTETPGAPERIYAPHGAAIFFRDTFFARSGTLHFRAFMYQEELFVAEQLRRMGQACLYAPDLRITHHESSTLRFVGLSARRQWKLESARVIRDDYFSA